MQAATRRESALADDLRAAESGVFETEHPVDDAPSSSATLGTVVDLHRNSDVVHADKDGDGGPERNATLHQPSATACMRSASGTVRSTARRAVRGLAHALFVGAVLASGVSHADIAAASGVSRQTVTQWMSGATVPPADCILLIIQRLWPVGVEILAACARHLPPEGRRSLVSKLTLEPM